MQYCAIICFNFLYNFLFCIYYGNIFIQYIIINIRSLLSDLVFLLVGWIFVM